MSPLLLSWLGRGLWLPVCVLMNAFLSGTRCVSESSTYLSLRSLRPPCKSLFWARPGPAQQPRWQEMLLQPSMQHNVFFMRICYGASLPQAMAAHFAEPCCQQQKLNSHRFRNTCHEHLRFWLQVRSLPQQHEAEERAKPAI